MPGVGLDGVGIATDSEHDDGVGGDSPGQARPAAGRQLLVRGWDLHQTIFRLVSIEQNALPPPSQSGGISIIRRVEVVSSTKEKD